MPELMLLTDPREEGNQQVSRFPAPDRSCAVAARFLLTLLHQGRPSNWGVRPTRSRAILRSMLRGEDSIMRNVWKCVLGILVGCGALAGNAGAQFKNGSQPTELNIPRASQRGTVTQRIGLTDVTITYHRPSV